MRMDYSKTPVWSDVTAPPGYTGSLHVGNGVFRSWCRGCAEMYETQSGQGSVPRYLGIGPHEVEAHGLDVPGINVGLLP